VCSATWPMVAPVTGDRTSSVPPCKQEGSTPNRSNNSATCMTTPMVNEPKHRLCAVPEKIFSQSEYHFLHRNLIYQGKTLGDFLSKYENNVIKATTPAWGIKL